MIINYSTEKNIQQQQPVQSAWLPGQDIPELLKYKENLVGIEIGVAEGISSKYILDSLPNCKLNGIDPYHSWVDWNGVEVNSEPALADMINEMKRFGERFKHHRLMSDEAVHLFSDESMDFIFIDGIHTYDQVLKDCRNYWPKLKKGGLFCGHDYTNISQVGSAVNFYANEIGYKISNARQDVWYWVK